MALAVAAGETATSLGIIIAFFRNRIFWIPAMPSKGCIYKMPLAGRTLSVDEMKGGLVIFEVSGDAGAGASGAVMFLGGDLVLSGFVGGVSGGSGQLPLLVATSKACVSFGGMTVIALPYNVGIAIYVGLIM
jgi:hypothetical protein